MSVRHDEARELVGQRVIARHWTGMRFDGELIGIVEHPSVMVKTDDGELLVYGIEMLDDLWLDRAASRRALR